jgi:hypothetical protein
MSQGRAANKDMPASLSGLGRQGHGLTREHPPCPLPPRPCAFVMRLARFQAWQALDSPVRLWQAQDAACRETAGSHKARAADFGQPTSEAEHLTVLSLFAFITEMTASLTVVQVPVFRVSRPGAIAKASELSKLTTPLPCRPESL